MAAERPLRSLVIALALMSGAAPASGAGAVKHLQTTEVRDFGYVIGDIVEQVIDLELEAPFRLDAEQLPEPGAVNLWLVREPIAVHESGAGAAAYRLTARYRLIGIPQTISAIPIPALSLVVSDGRQTLALPVPPWSITASPVTRIATDTDPAFITLRPDQRPLPAPLAPSLLRLALLGLGLTLAVAYFLYAFWALPWLARTRGPFARAHRTLRALTAAEADPGAYRLALRALHRAFNETAGKVLFADGLSEFFAHRPRFGALREPIEDLFARSQGTFFAAGAIPHDEQRALAELARLCLACRDIERGLA